MVAKETAMATKTIIETIRIILFLLPGFDFSVSTSFAPSSVLCLLASPGGKPYSSRKHLIKYDVLLNPTL
jgi:hypothetical protein